MSDVSQRSLRTTPAFRFRQWGLLVRVGLIGFPLNRKSSGKELIHPSVYVRRSQFFDYGSRDPFAFLTVPTYSDRSLFAIQYETGGSPPATPANNGHRFVEGYADQERSVAFHCSTTIQDFQISSSASSCRYFSSVADAASKPRACDKQRQIE